MLKKDKSEGSAGITDGSIGSSDDTLVRKKLEYSGGCSFLVSLLGCSMGNSDFWRFPYLVYCNGGGAFLIPFAIMMLMFGLPLYFMEVSLSQFSGRGPMTIWEISPFFKGLGITLLFINILGCVYCNILRAWIIEFFVGCFSSTLPWISCDETWSRPGCVPVGNKSDDIMFALNDSSVVPMTPAEQYWQYKVLKLSSGIDDLGGMMWNLVMYMFLWRVLVTLCMVKSIKSIEKVMFPTLFIPIVLMMVLWVRSLMLDGSVMGMLYYLTPDFRRLGDARVWLEAATMACYTLGPGYGAILLIGSHNKFSSPCLRYSVVSTVCDFLSAFINGLICFSILGVMAHDSGLALNKTVTSGLALGFTVYPMAFNYFPLPQLWAAIFFFTLILVGLDAQIIETETVVDGLQGLLPESKWFYDKKRVVVVVGLNILILLTNLPFCTQGGMYLFQLIDWYAIAWTLLFVSFCESVVFTWIYGTDRVSRDLMLMLGRPMPAVLRIFGSIVTPIGYLFLIIVSFIRYKPLVYGSYHYPVVAQVFGWCLAILLVLPIFVVFFVHLLRKPGPMIQRLRTVTRSSPSWQPNHVHLAKRYQDNGHLAKRSFISLLRYNVTGKSKQLVDQDLAAVDALIEVRKHDQLSNQYQYSSDEK